MYHLQAASLPNQQPQRNSFASPIYPLSLLTSKEELRDYSVFILTAHACSVSIRLPAILTGDDVHHQTRILKRIILRSIQTNNFKNSLFELEYLGKWIENIHSKLQVRRVVQRADLLAAPTQQKETVHHAMHHNAVNKA